MNEFINNLTKFPYLLTLNEIRDGTPKTLMGPFSSHSIQILPGLVWASNRTHMIPAVFLFFLFFFIFVFYKNIFSIWKFTGIYPGRPAASRPAAAAGAFLKKIRGKNCAQVPGGRSPDSGAAGPGRPAAGRSALPPLYNGWLVPHPSFASLKFQKPRKKREGGRETKPCRIFEPATAGNQNSSTLYK